MNDNFINMQTILYTLLLHIYFKIKICTIMFYYRYKNNIEVLFEIMAMKMVVYLTSFIDTNFYTYKQ